MFFETNGLSLVNTRLTSSKLLPATSGYRNQMIGMAMTFMQPKKMNVLQPRCDSMIGITNVFMPQPIAQPRMVKK